MSLEINSSDARLRPWQRKERDALIQAGGPGVLDIPDLQVLRFRTPSDLCSAFRTAWGQSPSTVVLPIASADGVNMVPTTADLPVSRSVEQYRLNLGQIAADFSAAGCDVALSVKPSFPFVVHAQYHLVDNEGTPSRQLCIGKQTSRRLIALTLADAIGVVQDALNGRLPRAVVFSAVDLWPMGAADDRINMTCFCDVCTESLENNGFEDALATFRTFPSPANLLLRENEHHDGISYVDTVRSTSTPDEVLGLSRLRRMFDGLVELDVERQAELAGALLEYLRARHDQTVEAVRDIHRIALSLAREYEAQTVGREEENDDLPRLILLTEGVSCGWTSGILLDRLDAWRDHWAVAPFDEVWLDATEEALVVTNLPYRSYMWRRARYILDSFFEFAAALSDPGARATTGIGRVPTELARQMLMSRMHQTLGGEMRGLTSLLGLAPLVDDGGSGRIGYVGVAFDERLGRLIVDSVDVAPEVRH